MKSPQKPCDPATREEWQAAVDSAEFAIGLHAARAYGLITGGPAIDVERCLDIRRRAAALGIKPRDDLYGAPGPEPALHVGDRVTLNAAGRQDPSAISYSHGAGATVIELANDDGFLRIRWDGRKHARMIHEDFLERAQPE